MASKNRTMQQKNLTNRKRMAKLSKAKKYDIMCQQYHYVQENATTSERHDDDFTEKIIESFSKQKLTFDKAKHGKNIVSKGNKYKGVSSLTMKKGKYAPKPKKISKYAQAICNGTSYDEEEITFVCL